MPLEHSTVLRWPQPSPGPPGEPGTLWTAHRLGSTLQTRTGSKAGSALPTMAACCSNGYPLPLYWQKKWPPIGCCLLPPERPGRGGSVRILKPADKSQLPPCSRAGLTPSPKAALAPGGRAATWPLWGQSVWFSAQARTVATQTLART